MIQIVEHKQIK